MATLKQRGQIVVGVKFDVPQFGFKNITTDKIEGFDVDMANEVAKALGKKLNKRVVVNAGQKIRETPGLKGIQDPEERRELLDGAFEAGAVARDKGILLLDDLYRSGATANAVTLALLAAGASRVYLLAATRTRSNV